MQLSQLEAFVTLAKLQSFSRAAEKLYITQPTLTIRIQCLEKELGHLLFERHGRTKKLTAVGNKLLPYFEQALSIISEGTESILEKKESELLISIVGTPVINSYYLPKYLKHLCANFNNKVSMFTAQSRDAVEFVKNGEIDVGFANSNFVKVPQSVTCRPLIHDKTLLVASPTHPYGPSISLRGLEKMQIIAYIRDSAFWRIIESNLQKLGIRLNVVLELDNFEAIKRMVIDDTNVVAFVPELAVSSEMKNCLLTEIAITPAIDFSRHISIFYLSSREGDEAVTRLINTQLSQSD